MAGLLAVGLLPMGAVAVGQRAAGATVPDPAAEPAPSGGDPTGEVTAPDGGEPPVPMDPDDPLANEGPAEEVPDTEVTVPPPVTYDQERYQPPEILWSSVAEAERKLERSREAKREAVTRVRGLRLRLKQLEADRLALDAETSATIDALAETTDRFRARAVVGFRHFGSGSVPDQDTETATGTGSGSGMAGWVESDPEVAPADQTVADPTTLHQVMSGKRRSRMVATALDFDERDLERLDRLRRDLGGDALAVLDRLSLTLDYLAEAEAGARLADDDIRQAEIEYEAFRAGSEIFISGVVFPIAGDHSLPLIDSFGAPRMTGTPDEHWHEGIDLFAPRGAPLVATERGVVTKVGSGRLGGLKFWLKGESGTEWYYAHLDSFAPGLADGLVVEAGQLLGYVGNTGNAVGTPPHLHLQMHPEGGRPVNPYPLLKVVSDQDQAAMAAGTHPGWANEPIIVGRTP